MIYVIYILAGLAGGILTGMAGLTAAMVLTPILCGARSGTLALNDLFLNR